MLSNPEAVSRIVFGDKYKNSQPDLDIYRPAFAGLGLHPKFAGTDLDGVFSVLIDAEQPEGGLWERNGYVLIQEHKERSSVAKKRGQMRALEALANISPLLSVILTYGDKDDPTKQSWQYVRPDGGLGKEQPFTESVENWPHRRWIKMAMNRPANDSGSVHDRLVENLELIAKIETWKSKVLEDVLAEINGLRRNQ